jgi:hypothetical protein
VSTFESKRCTGCNEQLPAEAFSIRKRKGRADSLRARCKACEVRAVMARPAEVRREQRLQSIARVHGSPAAMKQTQRRKAGAIPRAEVAERARQRRTRIAEGRAQQRRQKQEQRAAACRAKHAASHTGQPKHPEHVRHSWRIRDKQRRQQYHHRTNKRLMEAVRGMALGKAVRLSMTRLVAFTAPELRQHLEAQFTTGMDWTAFEAGTIHIDHVVPRARLVYARTNDPAFLALWSLSNLQPLWARDNLSKGARSIAA